MAKRKTNEVITILESYLPAPRKFGALNVPYGEVLVYPSNGQERSRPGRLIVQTSADGGYGVFLSEDGLCIGQRYARPEEDEVWGGGTDTARFIIESVGSDPDDNGIKLGFTGLLTGYQIGILDGPYNPDTRILEYGVSEDFCLLFKPLNLPRKSGAGQPPDAVAVADWPETDPVVLVRRGDWSHGFRWMLDGSWITSKGKGEPLELELEQWVRENMPDAAIHVLTL